ncbi:hypothetical protein MUG94_01320 [Arthrobacter gengyunqii]|uniref:Uncharacterized protein n=1 Tax=Arthrobacter gengyunqii TaxID=2886940 RepID=A0A9X1M3Q8_9MICC|nr:hypothetical protein [Arthrobacter gengyunqii]MCC3270843.1 hypothetical protein [Arthrobacter gengyunqii]UOY96465.1 hypothetical protein MUG94_01320 [Arthrobacter gengyunqii]
MIFRLIGSTPMRGQRDPSWRGALEDIDAYDLDDDAARARILSSDGLVIGGGADHLLLCRHREALSDFVRSGGRVLVNAQVVKPFIDGLAVWRKLEFSGAQDVHPHAVTAHPVWNGVDYRDLHYRTGVPGTHSYEKLTEIGVSGFYGRGYHLELPEGATVVTGIGQYSLPLDYSYPLGDGEVLVHGGNDLESFSDDRYSTGRIGPNLVDWLEGGSRGAETGTAPSSSIEASPTARHAATRPASARPAGTQSAPGDTPRIGLLHCGTFPPLRTLADPALAPYRPESVHLPDADPSVLAGLDVIIVGDRLHQGQLGRFAPAIRAALQDPAKTVIVLGENKVENWLPGVGYTFRPTVFWTWRTGEDNGTRLRLPEDPMWEFFTPRAVSWHHHGLLHPPAGARSLVVMEENGTDSGALLYVDEVNQPACLMVTTMDPVYHHGSGFMPGASQLLYSLLRWVTATHVPSRQAFVSAGGKSTTL